MYLDGARNCGIFSGFLQRTDSPGRFRLHQSALPGSDIPIIARQDPGLPDMAPVDVAGNLVVDDGLIALNAYYIDRATPTSIRGCSTFQRLGRFIPEGIERFVFYPMHKTESGWNLVPFVAENLREGQSNWGYPEQPDPMAGWLMEGILSPPKQRLMNRTLITGIALAVGPVEPDLGCGEERYFNRVKLHLFKDRPPTECRIYNTVRGYNSLIKSLRKTFTPITISGTLRGHYVDQNTRVSYIDIVDAYSANKHDLPDGIPMWLLKHIKNGMEMQKLANTA